MKRASGLSVFAAGLFLSSVPAAAQTNVPVTIQQPVFHVFGVQTTVMAPDSGRAYIGRRLTATDLNHTAGMPGLNKLAPGFGNRRQQRDVGVASLDANAQVLVGSELEPRKRFVERTSAVKQRGDLAGQAIDHLLARRPLATGVEPALGIDGPPRPIVVPGQSVHACRRLFHRTHRERPNPRTTRCDKAQPSCGVAAQGRRGKGRSVSAALIDGKAIAAEIQQEVAQRVAALGSQRQVTPGLAAVLVGDDPASAVYVRSKRRACEKTGIANWLHSLPSGTSERDLLELLGRLNDDAAVHGILVQLPLPRHIDSRRVLDAVDPLKDVDAFHPENVGLLSQGRPRFSPCTPLGVVELLRRSGATIDGADVVVLGRSDLVGKPLSLMLLQKGRDANATVTVCHSRTRDLAAHTRRANVVIAAIGQARFLKADMVKPGAVVIDVGINREGDTLVGDVDFSPVREIAAQITPVPGGVGPMTVAMLLSNTVRAAELQTS